MPTDMSHSISPTVSLLRATRYDDALTARISELLAPLGGMTAVVKPGDRVLLKPNLLTGARPTQECTTRPEVVAAVAQLVLDAGGKPFLGDSPAFGSARGVAKANGYLPMLEALGVPVVEFSGQRCRIENDEFAHLRLSKQAIGADVIINLPKVKSHSQLTVTLGVKNLFGCVPGKMKAWWHLEAGKDKPRFARMLVETARAIAPDLTIADGIIGHEGNGPSGGTPRALGVLAAARDPFALDRALVDILQVAPDAVPTIVASQALGLCPELAAITFPLAQPEALRIEGWKLPEQMYPIDFGVPRVMRSTIKHLYIRFIREPMSAYVR